MYHPDQLILRLDAVAILSLDLDLVLVVFGAKYKQHLLLRFMTSNENERTDGYLKVSGFLETKLSFDHGFF